jgi:hypothetical protein
LKVSQKIFKVASFLGKIYSISELKELKVRRRGKIMVPEIINRELSLFETDVIKFFGDVSTDNIKPINLNSEKLKHYNSLKYTNSAYLINDEYILNMEFQTKYYDMISFEMLYNRGELNSLYDLDVNSIGIHLLREHEEKVTGIFQAGEYGTKMYFKYPVFKVWELEPDKIFNAGLVGLYPLVPLVKKDKKLLKSSYEAILKSDISEGNKSDLLFKLVVLAGLIYEKEVINKMLSYNKMRESSVVQEWVNDSVIYAKREMLSDFIQEKFGEVPPEVSYEINLINEVPKLSEVSRLIFKSGSLEEVKEILQDQPEE